MPALEPGFERQLHARRPESPPGRPIGLTPSMTLCLAPRDLGIPPVRRRRRRLQRKSQRFPTVVAPACRLSTRRSGGIAKPSPRSRYRKQSTPPSCSAFFYDEQLNATLDQVSRHGFSTRNLRLSVEGRALGSHRINTATGQADGDCAAVRRSDGAAFWMSRSGQRSHRLLQVLYPFGRLLTIGSPTNISDSR
jgi:hypothetical protein